MTAAVIGIAADIFRAITKAVSLRYERFCLGSNVKYAYHDIDDDQAQGLAADPARQAALQTYIEQSKQRIDAINKELS